MGDVLVYVDPAINGRLLAFARPLADAAGGALVALVASGEPVDADALAAADVVLEVVAPRALPVPPGGAPGGARGGDQGALARRRPGREHHGRLRRRRRGGGRGGPPVRRLLPRACRWRAGRRSRSARSTAASCRRRCARRCRRCSRSTRWRCTTSRSAAGAGERVQLAPPAELDSLRTTFIEAARAAGRGRGPHDGRADRVRRPRHRRCREHRDRRGAGLGARRRARRVAAGHRFRLGPEGAADRQVGGDGDAQALPRARGLGCARARRGDAGRRS